MARTTGIRHPTSPFSAKSSLVATEKSCYKKRFHHCTQLIRGGVGFLDGMSTDVQKWHHLRPGDEKVKTQGLSKVPTNCVHEYCMVSESEYASSPQPTIMSCQGCLSHLPSFMGVEY